MLEKMWNGVALDDPHRPISSAEAEEVSAYLLGLSDYARNELERTMLCRAAATLFPRGW